MTNVKECIGKRVKINKNSITIQTEDYKTCGVVRNIVSFYDLQPNKQIEWQNKFRKQGLRLQGNISLKDCIISDNTFYVFRDIKGKLFQEQHGYFSDEEKEKAEAKETMYNAIKSSGIDIIECIIL